MSGLTVQQDIQLNHLSLRARANVSLHHEWVEQVIFATEIDIQTDTI